MAGRSVPPDEKQRPYHKDTKARRKHKDSLKASIERIPDELNSVALAVVDAAFKVHKHLGPGLLESVYEVCLKYELSRRGLHVRSQVPVSLRFEGIDLGRHLQLDLLVENQLIVELKSVDVMLPVFEAQILSYMRLSGKRLGLLINFNVPLIKDGTRRFAL